MLSTDRFTRLHGRQELVTRFGLFGIRLATSLMRHGTRHPAELADELVTRSGLRDLQKVLTTQFTERRDPAEGPVRAGADHPSGRPGTGP